MADVPPRSTQTSTAGSTPDMMTLLSTWGNNFTTQTHKTFSNLRAQDYIRLIIIIGAYALLRPYLMKLGAHMQMKQHQEASQASVDGDQDGRGTTAADLRGGHTRNEPEKKIAIPGVDSDSEEEEKDDWGRTARLRQRKMIRDLLVKQEERLKAQRDADSDKDIEEFLVD
ncbi:protein trafficking Pga2 [Phyllosticta citriasiana]|uniref:Protein trafficking Pga2 n=1 Tax=Phyllosticta citriasiana TaxID=595635 RepID=A0ABR1L364_9PEZI